MLLLWLLSYLVVVVVDVGMLFIPQWKVIGASLEMLEWKVDKFGTSLETHKHKQLHVSNKPERWKHMEVLKRMFLTFEVLWSTCLWSFETYVVEMMVKHVHENWQAGYSIV